MFRKVVSVCRLFPWLLVAPALLFIGGCYPRKAPISGNELSPPLINKIVVVGFREAIYQGEEPDIVRNPLSGGILRAEPVPSYVVKKMTGVLFDRLVEDDSYELVSPGQAKGVFSAIVNSDSSLAMTPLRILQEVGMTFEADAVLAGYIYRWREREGADYAIERPASVAFDLHLINPEDGTVLWKVKFDKTQQSLSENILDIATFVEGRGRWMTVEKLAIHGLNKALGEMPSGPEKRRKD
jgi:hypothetical protein